MIEGLKITVTAQELYDHLAAMATEHERKAQTYQRQVEELTGIGEVGLAVSNNPIQSLEQSGTSHQKRAAYFRFVCEHLDMNETYRLQEHDLERLEWFSRYG